MSIDRGDPPPITYAAAYDEELAEHVRKAAAVAARVEFDRVEEHRRRQLIYEQSTLLGNLATEDNMLRRAVEYLQTQFETEFWSIKNIMGHQGRTIKEQRITIETLQEQIDELWAELRERDADRSGERRLPAG